jgi:hypothetical protein
VRTTSRVMMAAMAVVLAGCASAGQSSGSTAGTVTGGGDSCAAASAAAHLKLARTVFIATALPGQAHGGVLVSPARFRVVSYLKGSGPHEVAVLTGLSVQGNAVTVGEDGIEPRAGQRWRIYTTSAHMPYETSDCGGSCVLGGPRDDVNITCAQEDRQLAATS